MVPPLDQPIPFQDVLDTMVEGCQLIDREWRYRYLNATALTHSRRAYEELLGRTMWEAYPGIETTDLFATLRQCMHEHRHRRMETAFVYPDGTTAWFELSIQPRQDGLLILSIDITARKHMEQALLDEQRSLEERIQQRTQQLEATNAALEQARQEADRANQAKSVFLSRMSHELRTPLNAILGFTQILQMDLKDADHQMSLHHILKGGRHLLTLINEVLDLARIETGHIQLVSEAVPFQRTIMEVVDTLRPLAAARGITLTINIESVENRAIQGDRQRFKQVLINLLSNAIKYNREAGSVHLTGIIDGNHIRLTVTDTGIGIPAGRLSELFTPFERFGQEHSMIEGSGLGLAIAKSLVELMDGTIEVSSEAGIGSAFVVTLPMSLTASVDDEVIIQPSTTLVVSKPTTILLIENNLFNLQLLERIFRAVHNLKLLVAMTEEEGIKLAQTHQPALILFDIHLSERHDYEVLQRLLAEPSTQSIPIVIITADATPRNLEWLQQSGVQAYLTKPLDMTAFLKTIQSLLDGHERSKKNHGVKSIAPQSG